MTFQYPFGRTFIGIISSLKLSSFKKITKYLIITQQKLTSKANLCPLKTQIPEMELLLSSPKRITEAKAFFFSFSIRWNIPVMRLQLMKTLVNSSLYLYSPFQIDQCSLSSFSQKKGMDFDSSSLE
jgi:hypothetical protein